MNKERVNFSSKSMWEPLRGYSRAVMVGDQLFISGTTSVDAKGEVVFPGAPFEQTKFVIERIRDILAKAGFALTDVIRTRLFVTNLSRWEDYAKAHREAFESIRPASSIVQVARLVDPRLTIEMEVDAIKGLELADSRAL
jgi:enamine deaminase RidA (YjgF/YER057c/UK114 family)